MLIEVSGLILCSGRAVGDGDQSLECVFGCTGVNGSSGLACAISQIIRLARHHQGSSGIQKHYIAIWTALAIQEPFESLCIMSCIATGQIGDGSAG